METVCQLLAEDGCEVCVCDEDDVTAIPSSPLVLTMGRSNRLLDLLAACEHEGTLVQNATAGVRLCGRRSLLETRLRQAGVTMPPVYSDGACWLKRGDTCTQTADDVVFVPCRAELETARQRFLQRGISDLVVSSHVEGDVVKFYGVVGTSFFRAYHADGDRLCERQNQLRAEAERAAHATGVTVYGGDAVIREDGSLCVIDFNDWPSFSRCREEAAVAIVNGVRQQMNRQ